MSWTEFSTTRAYAHITFTVRKTRPTWEHRPRHDAACGGKTYRLDLPVIHDLADNLYSVHADLAAAAGDHLAALSQPCPAQHPACNRLRALARQAIYETMRDETLAFPPFEHWQQARDLGIELHPAPAILRPFQPAALDPDLRPEPRLSRVLPKTGAYLVADLPPHDEQALWHALHLGGLQHVVYRPDPGAAGYDWHKALPTITAVHNSADDLPADADGRPDALTLFCTLERDGQDHPQVLELATDLHLPADGHRFDGSRPTTPFRLTRQPSSTPDDIAQRLVEAYWEACDAADADSWGTQYEAALAHCLDTATTLTRGSDAAFRTRALNLAQNELAPHRPPGKTCTVTIGPDGRTTVSLD